MNTENILDLRDAIAGLLREVHGTDDSKVIDLVWGYYQMASDGDDLIIEIESNSYIDDEDVQLTEEQCAALEQLGFTRPDDGMPNWWIGIEGGREEDIEAAALATARGLVEVLGHDLPGALAASLAWRPQRAFHVSRDRAAGLLVGTAVGDALGAGYEFGPPLAPDAPVGMIGGGLGDFAPGEWTDDTSMAVCIAHVFNQRMDPRTAQARDAIATNFGAWIASNPPDVGVQTRAVMRMADAGYADDLTQAARRYFAANPTRSAGNGALMRTAPVALFDTTPLIVASVARRIAELTHADPIAGDACVIWSIAIAHAVQLENFDGVREALHYIPKERRNYWAERLDEAETLPPATFSKNGWTVHALQAAYAAIVQTPVPEDDPADHFRLALENAVRVGHDTDTVAAIAGGLLGARWGYSAIPLEWTRRLHGWPGLRAKDLKEMAAQIFPADYTVQSGLDNFFQHPLDSGLFVGGYRAGSTPPEGIDAVVSLCRPSDADELAKGIAPDNRIEVWLSDRGYEDNPHLEHVLTEAARMVATLRAEGLTVLIHCVSGQSRTPTVASLYAAEALGVPAAEALRALQEIHPNAQPNPTFLEIIRRHTV
ncbi:ADP-ribosylglycohydrolase family protein [Tessaracoccus sp. MC1865]|uniref:ADP-ribosylglycohydrolase family protein n=1 Tax=Tessaracoccus sp. MC1865 TaxID=2760310 RepID=UPI001AE2F489|nr:ADP-ribosylglycohydrolase family protein [Tessaracoccus sp. MC1865]QTO38159.1 ADP-ribosylglycohydrolase family protein [Tessaracoccus sp. MC1865]